MNTIVLTVHNKESTIGRILASLYKSTSKLTTVVILILDGCTDKTEEIVSEFVYGDSISKHQWLIVKTDDIWETMANNVGLRMAKTKYVTIVQDDMLLKEKDWDMKLIESMEAENIFAVTGRTAHSFQIASGVFEVTDPIGREYPAGRRNTVGRGIGRIMRIFKPYWIFQYCSHLNKRLVANRGPLMISTAKLKELGYLDEGFAPFELDDVDLCCRAFKQYGLLSASKPIYYEEINGSKQTNESSSKRSKQAIKKNTTLLIEKHFDVLTDEN